MKKDVLFYPIIVKKVKNKFLHWNVFIALFSSLFTFGFCFAFFYHSSASCCFSLSPTAPWIFSFNYQGALTFIAASCGVSGARVWVRDGFRGKNEGVASPWARPIRENFSWRYILASGQLTKWTALKEGVLPLRALFFIEIVLTTFYLPSTFVLQRA